MERDWGIWRVKGPWRGLEVGLERRVDQAVKDLECIPGAHPFFSRRVGRAGGDIRSFAANSPVNTQDPGPAVLRGLFRHRPVPFQP